MSGPWNLVAICGSITRNGEAEEFERAGPVMEWLWAVLHRLGSEPSLVLVPGTSDRGLHKQRPAYLVDERDALRREQTDEPTRVASELAEFARFQARQREDLRQKHLRSGMLPGDSSLEIERDGLRVGVLGLNTTIAPAVDADLEAERIAVACGADATRWVRRSDAVIVIASHEDGLSAARFVNHAVPLVWLCRGNSQALAMRSRGGRAYLVVSAPQLYVDTAREAFSSAGDSFGYSAGRLWVSDDQAQVRVWHRCLFGDEDDQELRRLRPPPNAIVE